jgi:hypothetical protein
MPAFVGNFWQLLKDNDAPNWIVILISLFVWPAILHWWFNRNRQSIPNLEVLPTGGQTTIHGQLYTTVDFAFKNRTGSVVYLYHARLRESPKRFPVPPAAARNISDGSRELKFAIQQNVNLLFVADELVLQANSSGLTNIAVTQSMGTDFFSYRPSLLRIWFRRPKYFLLQYTAMVGEKKYSVSTVY